VPFGGLDSVTAFCSHVLKLHKGIRFAGIANSKGKISGYAYRKGAVPLLNAKEMEIEFLLSLIRAGTRIKHEKHLGKVVFSSTIYEKVRRVTIPLRSKSGELYVFLLSFDVNVNHEPIVYERVIPLLAELIL
jgi:hypothetical protein